MKKLRRNICCLIIVIVMLLTICLPSYAATLEVNKQKLVDGFNGMFNEPLEEGWTSTGEAKLQNITDTEIEILSGDEIYKFSYEITEKNVVFKKNITITDGMTYEKYEEETSNLSMPLLGYIAVNNIAGVEVEKSVTYILSIGLKNAFSSLGSLNSGSNSANNGYIIVADGVSVEASDNQTVIKQSEFGKYAIEYAEYSYKDMKEFNDSNYLNTFSIEYKTDNKDGNLIIENIVTVNLDGDFSKINDIDSSSILGGALEGAVIASIENTVKEEITLACGSIRLAIAEAIAKDNTYSAKENSKKIQEAILKTLKESELSEADGWVIEKPVNDGDETFEIVYQGEDYKKACKSSEANIKYTIKVGTSSIQLISEEKNHGKNDNYGEDNTTKHVFTVEIKKQPTCTEKGETVYKCKNCDYTYTKDLPALKHNYIEKLTTAPTCSVEGSRTYVCEHCHDSYNTTIPTGKHNYEERMRNDAECEKDGTIRYICRDCGDLYVKVTSKAKGHNYVETTTKATCTNSGIKTYKCSHCEESYTEVIAKATGHNYKETVEGNTKKYTCSNCGHSYTQPISNINNDIQANASGIDYNKIIIIVGSVMLGLIVVIVIAIIILKSRE